MIINEYHTILFLTWTEFNTSHYKQEWGATVHEEDPDMCQYRGYRYDMQI